MSYRTRLCLVVLVVAGWAVPARAQYWNGWGGGGATTAGGSAARGMGVFAAGAGSYNEQTAQARSINANTAMQFNEYMYQSQQRRNQQYYAQLAERQKRVEETAATTYQRLHDRPEAADVHRGDALNIVLDELTDPAVYIQSAQMANQPITGQVVKNIPFQYAAAAITISLDDLTGQGVPDVLLTRAAFEPNRQEIRKLVAQARVRELAKSGQPVPPELMANLRAAIKKAETNVGATLAQGTPVRAAADNFLKALYGLTKMLQQPSVAEYLKDLKADQTTTLGQLLAFMHTFNLRFGVAGTPVEQANYDQLYPMLVALRNQVNPPARNPVTAPVQQPDHSKATAFFSQMSPQSLGAQGDGGGQAPAPPPPGPGR